MGYSVKTQTAKVVDLATGMIVEADLKTFDLEDIEKSVTAIVWSTGCPVYDRVPWLLKNNYSRVLEWQELVEPGSMIVLVEEQTKPGHLV